MEAAKIALRGEIGRRLQDQLLIDILNHAPDATAIFEVVPGPPLTLPFLYVNDACESLYLAKKQEMIGTDVVEFMSRRSFAGDVEKTLSLLSECKPFTSTRSYLRDDGTTVWLEVNFRPFIVEHEPVRWIFIARDITAKRLLQDRAMQLSIAVEEGSDLVAISTWDELTDSWRFDYVNEAFTRTTGYLPEEIIDHAYVDIMPIGDAVRHFAEIREKLFTGEPVRDEIQFLHKDGRLGTFIVNSKPIADPTTGKYTSIVTILRDVTEERLQEQRLQYEAEHDPLTGLHNRRYFERILKDSVAMQRPASPQHALLFVDLDRFKIVNDRYGHQVGDEALKATADAFKRCISGSDVLVRWGGDEFAAMLFHCHIQSARRIAQCMLDEMRKAAGCRHLTASIGAVPVVPGESASQSVTRADMAAYQAKLRGGDCVAVQET